MTTLQRELISRSAAAVLGLALIYGGWRCIAKGLDFARDSAQRESVGDVSRRARGSGLGLPIYAGVILLIVGIPIAGIAVVPTRWIEKVYRVSPPVTHEHFDGDSRRVWWPFRWL